MKLRILIFLSGLALGYLIAGLKSAPQTSPVSEHASAAKVPKIKDNKPVRSALHRDELWYPRDEDAFASPRSDEDRQEVIHLIQLGLKLDTLPARMKAVADLCDMMTPENAHTFRDAFEQNREDGFNRPWERTLFFARYGEVLGAEAADEYNPDHGHFGRIVTSFAQADIDGAIDWSNSLPDGPKREKALRNIMYGGGMSDPAYGLRVFEVLHPEEQQSPAFQKTLFIAVQRSGGTEELNRLATDLLSRPDEQMQAVGRNALIKTFNTLRIGKSDDLTDWLNKLPEEHLQHLNKNHFPEDFNQTR